MIVINPRASYSISFWNEFYSVMHRCKLEMENVVRNVFDQIESSLKK
jgi:hypothetical protein